MKIRAFEIIAVRKSRSKLIWSASALKITILENVDSTHTRNILIPWMKRGEREDDNCTNCQHIPQSVDPSATKQHAAVSEIISLPRFITATEGGRKGAVSALSNMLHCHSVVWAVLSGDEVERRRTVHWTGLAKKFTTTQWIQCSRKKCSVTMGGEWVGGIRVSMRINGKWMFLWLFSFVIFSNWLL